MNITSATTTPPAVATNATPPPLPISNVTTNTTMPETSTSTDLVQLPSMTRPTEGHFSRSTYRDLMRRSRMTTQQRRTNTVPNRTGTSSTHRQASRVRRQLNETVPSTTSAAPEEGNGSFLGSLTSGVSGLFSSLSQAASNAMESVSNAMTSVSSGASNTLSALANYTRAGVSSVAGAIYETASASSTATPTTEQVSSQVTQNTTSSGNTTRNTQTTNLHAESIMEMAKELKENPNLLVSAQIQFANPECQQEVLDRLFNAEPQDNNIDTLTENPQIQWSMSSDGVTATSVILNSTQMSQVIGGAIRNSSCIEGLSVESAYLPTRAQRIAQSSTNFESTSQESEMCVALNREGDNSNIIQEVECRGSAIFEPPSEDVLNSPEGEAARHVCIANVAIVSDGLSNSNFADNIRSSGFMNGSRLVENNQTSSIQRVNGISPTFINNTNLATTADRLANSMLSRCPDLQIDDVNVTERFTMDSHGDNHGPVSVLTAQMLMQTLAHLLSQAELPDVVAIMEPVEIPNYYPNPRLIEIFVEALAQRGVSVMAYASSPGSFLSRVRGVTPVSRVSDVVGRMTLVQPRPFLSTAEIISMGTLVGLGALTSALGLCLYFNRMRLRRRTEPAAENSVEMQNLMRQNPFRRHSQREKLQQARSSTSLIVAAREQTLILEEASRRLLDQVMDNAAMNVANRDITPPEVLDDIRCANTAALEQIRQNCLATEKADKTAREELEKIEALMMATDAMSETSPLNSEQHTEFGETLMRLDEEARRSVMDISKCCQFMKQISIKINDLVKTDYAKYKTARLTMDKKELTESAESIFNMHKEVGLRRNLYFQQQNESKSNNEESSSDNETVSLLSFQKQDESQSDNETSSSDSETESFLSYKKND